MLLDPGPHRARGPGVAEQVVFRGCAVPKSDEGSRCRASEPQLATRGPSCYRGAKKTGTGRGRVTCPRIHTRNSPLRERTTEMELESSSSSRVWNVVRLKLGLRDSEAHVSVPMLYIYQLCDLGRLT